ncbi:Putative CID domain-containing protein [Colletotrichum destructivum]|uniref:CID domain-containing protein n=1 Tax=Colletotrichum destructivum TaxID=34406 RepID=A0AAX4I0P9_9PEZI|nr:Putative CID domain-containing protein [Colletotrichum destructivum]
MASAPPVLALEVALKAIPDHKAPGITGTRIAAMTSICVDNVQYESALVQKLFTYFTIATPPYKLGVLYVIDSVIRKWLAQARSRQQVYDENAADGTCGAGAHRLTVLMPNLIDDLLRALPDGHKDKLHKLIGIWRKASTFPDEMIESFQSKLEATPVPVPNFQGQNQGEPQCSGQSQIHKQSQHGGPDHNNGQQQNGNQTYSQPQIPVQAQSITQVPTYLPNLLPRPHSIMPQEQQQQQLQQQQPQPTAPPMNSQQFPYSMPPFTNSILTAPNPARFLLPPAQSQGPPTRIQFSDQPRIPKLPCQVAGVYPNTAQQMAMFRMTPSQGTATDRFAVVLTSVSGSHNGVAPVVSTAPAASSLSTPPAPAITAVQNHYISGQGHGGSAQPNDNLDQHRYDNRARFGWPSRRDSRVKRRGSKHRQRNLPLSRDGSRSNGSRHGSNDKRVELDRSLSAGHIKSLSRSLLSRSMQTRWSVGFGPRDASDYGNNSRPIVPGLVVEAPDIEHGVSVSPKAISRRMQRGKSGNDGPRSVPGGLDACHDDPGRRSRNRGNRRGNPPDGEKDSVTNGQPPPQPFPLGIGTLHNDMTTHTRASRSRPPRATISRSILSLP